MAAGADCASDASFRASPLTFVKDLGTNFR
jgi:hypothetical protein